MALINEITTVTPSSASPNSNIKLWCRTCKAAHDYKTCKLFLASNNSNNSYSSSLNKQSHNITTPLANENTTVKPKIGENTSVNLIQNKGTSTLKALTTVSIDTPVGAHNVEAFLDSGAIPNVISKSLLQKLIDKGRHTTISPSSFLLYPFGTDAKIINVDSEIDLKLNFIQTGQPLKYLHFLYNYLNLIILSFNI